MGVTKKDITLQDVMDDCEDLLASYFSSLNVKRVMKNEHSLMNGLEKYAHKNGKSEYFTHNTIENIAMTRTLVHLGDPRLQSTNRKKFEVKDKALQVGMVYHVSRNEISIIPYDGAGFRLDEFFD